MLPLSSHCLKEHLPLFLQPTWLAAVFKREGNDRHGPPTSPCPPLGGMEFETVAKADFREAMRQLASLRRISLAFSPEQFLSFWATPPPDQNRPIQGRF